MIQLQLDSTFRTIAMPILHDSEYQNMKKYVAHGHYSVYDHCFRVALFAYSYAKIKGMKVDYRSLISGSLLHDYYLYNCSHTAMKAIAFMDSVIRILPFIMQKKDLL